MSIQNTLFADGPESSGKPEHANEPEDRADAEATVDEASFRLSRLEVYNWGPFGGLHQIDFDDAGTAIIGPTGSGKTTLVDALMTLLVSQPRYNLASTGGNESDRDLVSYVRGVLGGDGSDGHEQVARPGKTMTGIAATYASGNQVVRLGALLWTEGSSNATADLKRRWIFSTAPDQTLDMWLRTRHEEGVRELMKMGRETAGLRIFESKKQYLAQTHNFFDVGDNAFTLLNRAAGLKQLNSIDEIFRELVLDDRSMFDRALEVAAEFDNLAAIHAELETARKQRDALMPIEEEEKKRQKLGRKTERLRTLQRIVPTWFAIQGCRLWKQHVEQLGSQLAKSEADLQAEKQAERACQLRVDQFRESYLRLGGGIVAQLEETIGLQKQNVEERRKHASVYQQLTESLQLNTELTIVAFNENQSKLKNKREQLSHRRESKQTETLGVMSQARSLQEQLDKINNDLRKVKERPRSNIPPQFQEFRDELAKHLSLGEEDLPYLAELVEVKADQSAWRGAIERAIGSERLRVLVPEDHMRDALRWVNHRDNRIHVRLQTARLSQDSSTFFADSFANNLNFRSHPLQAAAKSLIAARDYHCVESADELGRTEHGLTIEGTMSGRGGRFEKQDQRRLADGWLTGFDNKAQLRALLESHQETNDALQNSTSAAAGHQRQLNDLDGEIKAVDQLLLLDFTTIDVPEAAAKLLQYEERLSTLLDPDSDASKAKELFDAENAKLTALRESVAGLQTDVGVIESKIVDGQSKLSEAEERVGKGLDEEQLELAAKSIQLPDNLAAQRLDEQERKYVQLVNDHLNKHATSVAEQEKRLIRCMEAAKRTDTGELADIGSELEDVQHYLDRLTKLRQESLPEKLKRFLDYLNLSSDQGVTQLLEGIQLQVDAIEDRIAELNQTLLKVDFRSGRYLQLKPQRVQDERKRALDTALRTMRSAALKDDQGESHYKALRTMVDILRDAANNRRQVGSRALLDPRYRLNFFVVEVDRSTGSQSPPRTGSQSGSGGEKELMASHILTASLSYALCPAEATRPLYASVILDEAFSKSSPSAATRIIEALRVFELHPIFVTPNKEIGLLKRHTRKVICVQRIGRKSSVASIRWEELEQLAQSTNAQPNEHS